jgi:hypothetical protein
MKPNPFSTLRVLLPAFLFLSATACDTPVQKADSKNFELDFFTDEDIPQEYSSQVDGAGCYCYKPGRQDLNLVYNGLVKINGIYEILRETEGWSENTFKYENSRWILQLKLDPNNPEKGRVKLRSKSNDGEYSATVDVFCGT